jgi:hypothetical protein
MLFSFLEATIKFDGHEKASKIALFVLEVLGLVMALAIPTPTVSGTLSAAGPRIEAKSNMLTMRRRPWGWKSTAENGRWLAQQPTARRPRRWDTVPLIPLGLCHGIYFCRASARYGGLSPVRTYSTTA